MATNSLRKAVVAGTFYPEDPHRLRDMVGGFLDDAAVEPAPERVRALVSPHAGLKYSGATAGHGYKRVEGKAPKRVVLLGCSHHYPIETASVFVEGAFESPMGVLPIDEPFAEALAEKMDSGSPRPHREEHSLEVQLPFLLAVLGEVPIVPVLFGELNALWHVRAGELLAEMVDEEDLVVVSTDLSHFLREEEANALDRHSLDTLLSEDIDRFVTECTEGTSSMCGSAAVVVGMAFALARKARDWSVLDYRTSFKASGDPSRVVGYAAVSMEQAA